MSALGGEQLQEILEKSNFLQKARNPTQTQHNENLEKLWGVVILLHTLIVLGLGWVLGLWQKNQRFRGPDFVKI